ncbi:50S ribosomal protein L18 [Candidatus Saccharibacteria bacterium RIFCSPHIGHO2_12_FULL_47_16b]|nr:MAG: 50S ribosomal protein L18 [Candidatus Saccharibacteria bacterium RIFCSPHIGHO2_12_FULL_47_16b]OGL39375.1 MAG: 50S ribosomal protein L18 [Candidatus Saccharibacteria bacterium RIFCSPLOWO2_02_FULL_46_7]
MTRLVHKIRTANRRTYRVRSQLKTTGKLPRLSVHISNRQVLAQIIDDNSGQTIVYVTSVTKSGPSVNLTAKASWVGEQLAQAAKKAKVKQVVFDRGPKKYHGRIAALAEAARKGGMEF